MYEIHGDTSIRKNLLMPRLDKESALVAEEVDVDDEKSSRGVVLT